MKLFPLFALLLLITASNASSSVTDTLKRKERRVDTIIVINPQTMEEEKVIDKLWDPTSKNKVIHTGRFHGRDSAGVYTFVNENPEFPGGDSALVEYIQNQTRYPESKIKDGILRKSLIRFIVNPDGSVRSPVVLRSAGTEFDEEAIRVIKSLPKFIPGKQDGKPVPVYFNLPIRFEPALSK